MQERSSESNGPADQLRPDALELVNLVKQWEEGAITHKEMLNHGLVLLANNPILLGEALEITAKSFLGS